MRQLHSVLDRCAPVEDLSRYAASALIGELDRAVTRLQAVKLSLVAVVDRSEVAADSGMTGTAAWLAARSRSDGATAAKDVRFAGAAHLDTGHDLSASQVRRLACGAGIVPAVLDGESQVLDLGRSQRFFTEAQRVALALTYDTCAAEDCDRPYAWTEHHHQDPWATGGRTDLAMAVPLCGYHHRRIHDPGFHHRVAHHADRRKRVTFVKRS